MQRLEKILAQKAASKSARMAKLWQFSQGHPKPAFCVKVQTGDQGKFLKNPPKRSPGLKGPKAHWRKWHYRLFCTHLKCKHCRTFWRKQVVMKMGILGTSSNYQNCIKSTNKIPEYAREYKKEYLYIRGLNKEFKYFIDKLDDLNNGLFESHRADRIKYFMKRFLRG